MKRIFSLLVALTALLCCRADPNWLMHPPFNDAMTHMVETPAFVYFTARTQPYTGNKYNALDYQTLFRYDKENDELQSLSTDNVLSSNTVAAVSYSPVKNYLAVAHHDGSVDLLHDDGSVSSITAYRNADVANGKDIRSIFIDETADRIYLSTGFGYVALNDKKLEVAESRNYGHYITAMGRVGDWLLAMYGSNLYAVPLSSPRLSWDDFTRVAGYSGGRSVHSVTPDMAVACTGSSNDGQLQKITVKEGKPVSEKLASGIFQAVNLNRSGLVASAPGKLHQVSADGTYTVTDIPEDDAELSTTYDLKTLWNGARRKGIWAYDFLRNEDDNPTMTHRVMVPNAPAPFQASEMVWHPKYGMLVSNHGFGPVFPYEDYSGPMMLSGYRNGEWTNYSPAFVNPSMTGSFTNPNGLAVDPVNSDWVYFGNVRYGIRRINLSDPDDLLHLSRTSDPDNRLPDYVKFVEDQTGQPSAHPDYPKSSKSQTAMSAPRFDSAGNMWFTFNDIDDQNDGFKLHLYCWPASDRKQSTSPQTVILPTPVTVKGYLCGNGETVVPLVSSKQKNILVYSSRIWTGSLVLIDTKGTPTDTSDDKTVGITSFVDQDGNTFDVIKINEIYEDPLTGYVWVCHGNGVFHFKPENFFGGNQRVTRVKVARNDGTNLADYLLDGIPVNKITVDGRGRKWFSTSGAGIVVTSSDGRSIEQTFTTDNSPLPSNTVYGMGYNPANNSMLVGGELGLCEYFINGASSAGDELQVRAYPNPVRPDYFGYVTIDGLADNTLVKIVDAAGNIVKELGSVSGGEVKWDVTNMAFRRVNSGVYFILAQTDDTGGNLANIGKILVIN